MPTQEQFNIVKQKNKNIYAKINLLNYKFQKVDGWENVVIGSPTFTNDSNSDIRRTCSISLVPINKTFDIEYGNKIWMDKYIQIFLGIQDIHTKEIIYTNMGIYIIDNPSRAYSAIDNTISIQGVDLMAKLTGLRNGNLEGVEHRIPSGSNIRNVMIETIKPYGFDRYSIDEFPIDVPNDINISIGGTAYDILKQLLDILPNYQMYFNEDGIFCCNKIPSGKNEQIMVDDTLWQDVLISYNKVYDFDNVKNVIEVYGKTHDVGDKFNDSMIDGDTYIVNIASISYFYNNLKFGFIAPTKLDNPQIKLNNFDTKPLLMEDGSIPILEDRENVYYVARYDEEEDCYIFLGEVTPYGMIEETDPTSPFYVDGTMGRVRIVLTGDEYDNIYTSSLAQQRAKWELYKRCRLLDNITITCVPIYWLDVNWLIEITLPNKNGKEEKELYMIKSINTSFGVSDSQTINLMRYSPYYDFE